MDQLAGTNQTKSWCSDLHVWWMGIGSRGGSSLFCGWKENRCTGILAFGNNCFCIDYRSVLYLAKTKRNGKMDDVIKIEKPPAVSAVRGFSNVVLSQTMITADSICGLKYVRK